MSNGSERPDVVLCTKLMSGRQPKERRGGWWGATTGGRWRWCKDDMSAMAATSALVIFPFLFLSTIKNYKFLFVSKHPPGFGYRGISIHLDLKISSYFAKITRRFILQLENFSLQPNVPLEVRMGNVTCTSLVPGIAIGMARAWRRQHSWHRRGTGAVQAWHGRRTGMA